MLVVFVTLKLCLTLATCSMKNNAIMKWLLVISEESWIIGVPESARLGDYLPFLGQTDFRSFSSREDGNCREGVKNQKWVRMFFILSFSNKHSIKQYLNMALGLMVGFCSTSDTEGWWIFQGRNSKVINNSCIWDANYMEPCQDFLEGLSLEDQRQWVLILFSKRWTRGNYGLVSYTVQF